MRPRLVLALAGTVVALVIAAAVKYQRVTMQTPGAEPNHYSSPTNSPTLTSANTVAHDLACTGATVAVADIARGLSLYKYGSWRRPLSTVKPPTALGYWRVVIQGHFAYAPTHRGFDIIDISQPASASIVGEYLAEGGQTTEENSRSLGGLHERLDVSGAYAYLTDDLNNLHIVDIHDPAQPTRVGVLGFGNTSHLTAVAAGPDRLVYVGVYGISGHRGVQVVDVSTPSQPSPVSFTVMGGEPGLALNDGMLFVVSSYLDPWRQVLEIFRAGPTLTKVSELVLHESSCRIVKICGKQALIAYSKTPEGEFAFSDHGYSGVELLDIADPARPKRLATFSTPGLAQAAINVNRSILVAGGVAGLLVKRRWW